MWIFRTGKNGRTKAPEPESRRDGQVRGRRRPEQRSRHWRRSPEGCRRRIMRTGSWRRFLSVPTGNRSAAIRRETPWVRERPKPGVQAGPGHRTGGGQRTDGPGRKTDVGRPRSSGTARADGKTGRGAEAADTSSGTEEEYLLVDGYNIIFAWEELSELAKVNIDGARYRLMDILCNYQGYKKCTLIVVFDAYKVEGNTGEAIKYHNIHVVYTKEAETADQYIEKLAHKIGPRYRVTVATSDGLEQLIIRGQGCLLLSARDLKEEVDYVESLIADEQGRLKSQQRNGKNYLLSHADGELREYLETVRLGNAGTSGRIDKEKP